MKSRKSGSLIIRDGQTDRQMEEQTAGQVKARNNDNTRQHQWWPRIINDSTGTALRFDGDA